MSIAQMLESYVLTPMIVGDEVSLNPLTTIICVVGMSILWGPIGAIIAIPMFAILRIVFSHVDGLKNYAYLIGQK
jgi:predicted PurR-regulated permease PerM